MSHQITKINYYEYLNIIKNKLYDFGVSLIDYTKNIQKLFVSNKKITNEDMIKTIGKLKEIQNNITIRINEINKKVEKFYENAKKDYKNNNKKSAIFNLKLKKMYLGEKIKLEKINFNIETQIFNIDSFGIIYQTADILKDSAIKINLINKNIDIEKIENTIEQLNELSDMGDEINDVFSTSYIDSYDEDELLKELEPESYNKEQERIIIRTNKVSNNIVYKEDEIEEFKKLLPIVPKGEIIELSHSDI